MNDTHLDATNDAGQADAAEINNGYNLFRAEAVDYRFRRLTGRVSLESTKRLGSTAAMGTLFITLIVLIFTQLKVPVYTRISKPQAADILRQYPSINQVTIVAKTTDGKTNAISHTKDLDDIPLDSGTVLYTEHHHSLSAAIFANNKDTQ